MSNKSPIELLAAGGLLAEVAGDADEKSPKSAPKLSLGLCVDTIGCTEGDACFGCGGGCFESKNPPPLNGGGDLTCEACLECPVGAVKLENGVALC